MLFLNSLTNTVGLLQNFMLPCFFKKWTGIDCPGCGFQRSVIALLKGDAVQSFFLYPAAIPVLVATAIAITDALKPNTRVVRFKRPVYLITAATIVLSYAVKIGGQIF